MLTSRSVGDRLLGLAVGATVLASVLFVAARGASAPTSPKGDQWEYLVVQGGTMNYAPSGGGSLRKEESGAFAREQFALEGNLDKLGAAGWELVGVSGSPNDPVYYLKRRKQ